MPHNFAYRWNFSKIKKEPETVQRGLSFDDISKYPNFTMNSVKIGEEYDTFFIMKICFSTFYNISKHAFTVFESLDMALNTKSSKWKKMWIFYSSRWKRWVLFVGSLNPVLHNLKLAVLTTAPCLLILIIGLQVNIHWNKTHHMWNDKLCPCCAISSKMSWLSTINQAKLLIINFT